jgi:hypothetical protein
MRRLCWGANVTGACHHRLERPSGNSNDDSRRRDLAVSKQLKGSKPASLPWRAEEAYAAEIELERARWKAITAFVELLTEDERLAPGYYRDPAWSVRDLIAHLGS